MARRRSAARSPRSIASSPTLIRSCATQLHDQAYTAGFQFTNRWDSDRWQMWVHGVESYVHGTEQAITFTQEDSNHFYQRPDATDVTFDPTRTSLTSPAWQRAKWRGSLGQRRRRASTGASPRAAICARRASSSTTSGSRPAAIAVSTSSGAVSYREDKPPGAPPQLGRVGSDIYQLSTLEPRLTDVGTDWNANAMLENYWNLFAGGTYDYGRWDVISMRGGRALHSDPNVQPVRRDQHSIAASGSGFRVRAQRSTARRTTGLDRAAT